MGGECLCLENEGLAQGPPVLEQSGLPCPQCYTGGGFSLYGVVCVVPRFYQEMLNFFKITLMTIKAAIIFLLWKVLGRNWLKEKRSPTNRTIKTMLKQKYL